MTDVLFPIAIVLGVSFIFSEIFYRLRYPRVIGQIVAGMFLGLPFFAFLFTSELQNDIYFLAELGIIFLLLLTGLEINLQRFRDTEKDSIWIAFFSVLVPFTLGFALVKAFGYSNLRAFVVGACLSLTAEGTTLKVLIDMKALNTKIGTIMVGSGIFDDMIGILFLLVVSFFISHDLSKIIIFPIQVILFIALVYLTYKLFPLGLRKVEKEHSTVSTFSFILLFGIIVAVMSQLLSIGHIVGAFIAGIIIHVSEHKQGEHKETVKELRVMTFSLIIPFFFIYIGFQFASAFPVVMENMWLALMILFIAIVGKVLGAVLAQPLTSLSFAQTYLVGWGMNSRGLIELVVVGLAFQHGIIPLEIFGSVVAAAVITTLAFPVMMKYIVRKNRKILN